MLHQGVYGNTAWPGWDTKLESVRVLGYATLGVQTLTQVQLVKEMPPHAGSGQMLMLWIRCCVKVTAGRSQGSKDSRPVSSTG